MSSAGRRRRAALKRWDTIARSIGLVGSGLILAAAIIVLQSDPSVDAAGPPPYGVPSKYYVALEFLGAASIGLIGVLRGSRPLLGAAGGLILPIGLMSLMVVPAVLLIAACGVLPASRKSSGRELGIGVVVVLLGLTPFFVPAFMSSPQCWVEIEDAAGIRYELTEGMSEDPVPGQRSATCAERVPDPESFPISVGLVVVALGLAVRSSDRRERGAAATSPAAG